MTATLRKILEVLKFIVLEGIPFAVWIYQHLSRDDSAVYWPYRERKAPPRCSRR